jgi:hypothetical protein
MNRIAMLLASTLAVAPALIFADVSGPTKPGARASYQPSRTTEVAIPTFHPSWQKAALWAQAKTVPATSRPEQATAAVSWRDTGVKSVLWRAPQPERNQARPALACAKECPCHGHAACAAPCGCTPS